MHIEVRSRLAQQVGSASSKRCRKRAHPDLNRGPADLQSAALTTELCTHMTGHDSIAVFAHLRELVQMPVRLDGVQVGCVQAGWKFAPTAATPDERVRENVHTRSRTWVVAATTRRPNHYKCGLLCLAHPSDSGKDLASFQAGFLFVCEWWCCRKACISDGISPGLPPADGCGQPLPCSLSGDVLSVGLVV